MDLTVSPVSFGSRRMTHKELNHVLGNNLTLPIDKKPLPKDLERQISPNLFQKIGNAFRRLFS